MTTTKGKCQRLISDSAGFRSYPCGRDIKGKLDKGDWLCGIHLAADKRKQAKAKVSQTARNGSMSNQARAEIALRELAKHGITGKVHFAFSTSYSKTGYTGKIVIDPIVLLEALGVDFKLSEILPYTS